MVIHFTFVSEIVIVVILTTFNGNDALFFNKFIEPNLRAYNLKLTCKVAKQIAVWNPKWYRDDSKGLKFTIFRFFSINVWH